jgi:glycosyltransferase involved in cell wall biosynthesis
MDNHNIDILTFCVKGFPGTNRSLVNLEKNTGLSRHFILANSDKGGPEIKFFVDYLKHKNPRLILFGGWSAIYDAFMKRPNAQKTQFGIYWTSSTGQVDISDEVDIFSSIIKSDRIDQKLFANRDLARALSRHISNVEYLPDTVSIPLLNSKITKDVIKERRSVIISLFCSPFEYKRKNVLNSLLAISMIRRRYVLYLNGLSINRYYKKILNSFNIKYRDFGWMSNKKYEKLLEEIDVGLQVSFAETFNHVVAEHLVRKIPVITSQMVPSMDNMPRKIKDMLIVNDVDDPFEIRDKIDFLICNSKMRKDLGAELFERIKMENNYRIKMATDTLNKILYSSERKIR